jgi:hypothetical protein
MRRRGLNETLIGVAGFFAVPFLVYFILVVLGILPFGHVPKLDRTVGLIAVVIALAGYEGGVRLARFLNSRVS